MPRVSYKGLIADVREEDLEDGIAHLRQCSRQERKQILRSVEKTLDQARRIASGKAALTEQQRQDIANDIGIWFAGEVLAGRAEQYKVAVQ